MNAIKAAHFLRLARWLGPWSNETKAPPGIDRRRIWVSAEPALQAYVYRTKASPRRSLLLLPGVHFLGPDHPSLDRLARIMASVGYLVMVPRVRAFSELQIRPDALLDAELAFQAFRRLPDHPVGNSTDVMSISFGSALAIDLASHQKLKRHVRRVVVYGGFYDWEATMRFALSGRKNDAHDPLNRPVVYLNLLEEFEIDQETRTELKAAWTEFCRLTWGREEMKTQNVHRKVANDLADRLHPDAQDLFLEGCNAAKTVDRSQERCLEALRSGDFRWLDLQTKCAQILSPITIIHGRSDDVIPHTEAKRLSNAVGPGTTTELLITGLYAHTKSDTPQRASRLEEWRMLLRILATLLG